MAKKKVTSTQFTEAGTFYAYHASTGELKAWPESATDHNLIGGVVVATLAKNLADEEAVKQAFHNFKQVAK